MTRTAWGQVRKLLCIRLDAVGHVLMCTPAMRAARESLPECTLTLLTSPAGAAAARYIPEVDAVLEYAAPWIKGSPPRASPADRQMPGHLAAQEFDAAVIFTSYSQSALPAALMCYLAGIPLRLAYARENPYRLLTHPVEESEPGKLVRHEVRRQLDLVAEVGWMAAGTSLSFALPAHSRAAASRWLAACGIDSGQPFILLHPGAGAASHRYPAPLWREVIHALHARCRLPLVLTGGDGERDLVEDIRAHCGAPVHSLAGLLDLGELGAAMAQAAVVIASNTGPAHIAAAVGTPLVNLYALTSPQHTPWQAPSRILFQDVPCRYCYKSICPEGHNDCLAKVLPQRVVDAACSLLAEAATYASSRECLGSLADR